MLALVDMITCNSSSNILIASNTKGTSLSCNNVYSTVNMNVSNVGFFAPGVVCGTASVENGCDLSDDRLDRDCIIVLLYKHSTDNLFELRVQF